LKIGYQVYGQIYFVTHSVQACLLCKLVFFKFDSYPLLHLSTHRYVFNVISNKL